MNKYIKRLIITLAIMIAFGGTFAGGVYASETLHRWAGSQDYTYLIENLDKSIDKWSTLKEKKDDLVVDNNNLTQEKNRLEGLNTSLTSQLASTKDTLRNKEAEYTTMENNYNQAKQDYEAQVRLVQEKQQIIDGLSQDKGTSDADLQQAITDMKTAREKSEELLNSMQD